MTASEQDAIPFEETQRLIVVAAHPDDIEITCGGTLALLTARGVEVLAINCTCGDIGTRDPVRYPRDVLCGAREEEAREALTSLGVQELVTLGHPDGELVSDLELRAEVARLYRRFQPDTLLTFDPWWQGQAHPDHTAAGRVALDAYMPSKMPLYRPRQLEEGLEVADIHHVYLFSTGAANCFVDISKTLEAKVEAVLRHRSQFLEPKRMREWLTERARTAGKEHGVEYAEVFRRMDVW